MSLKKPSHEEEEYIAREEAARRQITARERVRRLAEEERTRLKTLHYMKCPKCGFDLESMSYRGLIIDKCFQCNGTWLDAGELEALAGKDHHILDQIIGLFKHAPEAGPDR